MANLQLFAKLVFRLRLDISGMYLPCMKIFFV